MACKELENVRLVNWSPLSETTSAGMPNLLTQWLRKVLVMVLAVVAVVDHVLHIPGDPPPDGTCPHKSPRRTYAGMVNGGEFLVDTSVACRTGSSGSSSVV